METQKQECNGDMNPKTINLKKTMILGILLILSVFITIRAAHAFEWVTANQKTIAWDAVTTKTDGTAIPTTDTVEYIAYIANADSDPQKDNPAKVWQGPETQTVITLNVEGRFLVGIRAVRKIADGTEVGESTIAWSDTPVATNNSEFGIRFFFGPNAVTGLSPSPGG
jgi:hypothetical protein